MQVIYLFIQYKQINLFIQTVHEEHLFSPVFNELVVEHNKRCTCLQAKLCTRGCTHSDLCHNMD